MACFSRCIYGKCLKVSVGDDHVDKHGLGFDECRW